MTDAVPEPIPVSFELSIGGVPLTVKTEIPDGPADPESMLPAYRATTEAVLRAVEEAVRADGRQISCKSGCAACCRHLIPVSVPEAQRLAALVARLPPQRREEIVRRFAAAHRQLGAAGLLEPLRARVRMEPAESRAFDDRYFRLEVACPFLEEETCSIYAERPLRCREYLVVSPPANCANYDSRGVEAIVLPSEPSSALIQITSVPSASPPAWIPLILAMEAPKLTAVTPTRTGAEQLSAFLAALAGG